MIKLNNISKIYQSGKVSYPALSDINLEIERGEFVAIMGPSGSGKSTLLNIIGLLDTPTAGEYYLDGILISKLSEKDRAKLRNEKLGFIFQNYNLLPRLDAFCNVELPLIYSGNTHDRKEKVLKALRSVNLLERLHHKPTELSGGEQQRAAIARALVNEPAIILADEPTGNLDSKSGEEIMRILSVLNFQGITIIMVTHDENIAQYAQRCVRLKDGKIISDERKKPKPTVVLNPLTGLKDKKRAKLVNIKENTKMAISSIFTNKLRSFLTMLGIIVGVSAVITMIALGEGARRQVTQRISQMGANLLMVFPGSPQRGGVRGPAGGITTLTYDDALAIIKQCPEVKKVDATLVRNAQVVYENKNTNTTIQGVTENFPEIRNFPLERGSFISAEDNQLMRRVAVLGQTVVKNLFGDEDPIGHYIKIKRTIFQVIGVMSTKGSSGWRDEDDVVFIPLKTAQKRLFGIDYVSMINVMATSQEVMDKVEKNIRELLRNRHRIREGMDDDFTIRSQKEILSTFEETSRTFSMLLLGIAVVSLIVGGIGIMNIMFVSVTERTKEIGIRKAIGAQKSDILGQFLTEAIILSLNGGILGIIIGSSVSKLTSQFAGWPTVLTFKAILLSFTFAFLVGLFFGFYPAYKASERNPIDALRYE
jgi:macrolide transport system ATP-binding/permease protein